MYRTTISLKKDISQNQLAALTDIIIKNYDNRAGKLSNSSTDPYVFIFEGKSEEAFECMDLGTAVLADTDFIKYVSAWKFIDEEHPSDNCDILKLYLYDEDGIIYGKYD